MSQPTFEIWWLVIIGTASLILLAGGIIISIIYTQRKLYAQHREQVAKLSQSESRFRKLVELSPVPICIAVDGIINYVNDETLYLLAANHFDDIANRTLVSLVHPDFQQDFVFHEERVNKNGRSNRAVDTKLLSLDGEIHDVQITCIPMIIDEKQATYVVIRDITAEKNAEREIKHALHEAEKAEKLKSAFIANMSHEIRTPLNIIMGYSSVIAEAFSDRIQPEEKIFFESIERGGERLMRTIDAILSISRLEAGDISLSMSDVMISQYIEKIVLDIKPIADRKSISLSFTSDVTDLIVSLDAFLMEQAISNLIDNALKYTKKGSVHVHLYQDEKHDLNLDIHDTGIGISEEYIPHLFEPYSQEDIGFSRAYEGIGLGLSLVKKITELHHAEIKVRTSKGSGTTFTIVFKHSFLTIKSAERHVTTPVMQSDEAVPAIPSKQIKPIVLVVEDDEPTLKYMRHILKDDYEMYTTESASETWDFLSSHDVDIILMDISLLDETDGILITKQIRQNEKYEKIPIIAVTAHAFPYDRNRSLEAGCNEFLAKPIKKNLLLEKMGKQLSHQN